MTEKIEGGPPSRTRLRPATRANQATGTRTGVIDPIVPLQGRAFTIRADIDKSAGTLSREVAVRITDNPIQPYWVMSWKTRSFEAE